MTTIACSGLMENKPRHLELLTHSSDNIDDILYLRLARLSLHGDRLLFTLVERWTPLAQYT